jgi:hypothetical protein
MSDVEDETHQSPEATPAGQETAPSGLDPVAEAIRHGPRGALFVASIATALLFVGWLAFYFLLFIPRGSVG